MNPRRSIPATYRADIHQRPAERLLPTLSSHRIKIYRSNLSSLFLCLRSLTIISLLAMGLLREHPSHVHLESGKSSAPRSSTELPTSVTSGAAIKNSRDYTLWWQKCFAIVQLRPKGFRKSFQSSFHPREPVISRNLNNGLSNAAHGNGKGGLSST